LFTFEPATSLAPACAQGPGPTPAAYFGFGTDLDAAALAQHEEYIAPFERWLAKQKRRGRAVPARERRLMVRAVERLCDWIVYHARVPIAAVSELELRLFVYQEYQLSDASAAESGLMFDALEWFFGFLEREKQIETPWRAAILSDEESYHRRWDIGPSADEAVEQAYMMPWMAVLSVDLLARALLPDIQKLVDNKVM